MFVFSHGVVSFEFQGLDHYGRTGSWYNSFKECDMHCIDIFYDTDKRLRIDLKVSRIIRMTIYAVDQNHEDGEENREKKIASLYVSKYVDVGMLTFGIRRL